MICKKYEYCGYLIEIHEHPIYHDFEFVIKTLDETKIEAVNDRLFENASDAEKVAKIIINNL